MRERRFQSRITLTDIQRIRVISYIKQIFHTRLACTSPIGKAQLADFRKSVTKINGGAIRIDGVDVTSPTLDPIRLRREVGMVFQKSNPFPMSIYENVSYGLKLAGVRDRAVLDEAVEESLSHAALWDEVKDRLHTSANGLSGGQQQRLCIARSIAVKPRILLMDEPCSALDPIATVRVEELMHRLKEKFTIVVVTHNMQQATRVSDLTGFFMLGRLVEFDSTEKIFSHPSMKETEDYITGRFS